MALNKGTVNMQNDKSRQLSDPNKYSFYTMTDDTGAIITVVTQLTTGLQKTFFQRHGSEINVFTFMHNMSDVNMAEIFKNK